MEGKSAENVGDPVPLPGPGPEGQRSPQNATTQGRSRNRNRRPNRSRQNSGTQPPENQGQPWLGQQANPRPRQNSKGDLANDGGPLPRSRQNSGPQRQRGGRKGRGGRGAGTQTSDQRSFRSSGPGGRGAGRGSGNAQAKTGEGQGDHKQNLGRGKHSNRRSRGRSGPRRLDPTVTEWNPSGGRRKGGPKPVPRAVVTVAEEEDDGHAHCAVCAEELLFYGVGECNHPEVCSMCLLRLRVLVKDRACPICKTLLDKVVVSQVKDNQPFQSYESFGMWGDICPPGMDHDEEADMFFSDCNEHFEALLLLRANICGVCFAPQVGREALLDHLRRDHQRVYCLLCVEHRPRFLQEQELFTPFSLKKHQTGLGGHPACQFCNQRYYDDAALYRHMNNSHQNCPLCPDRQHKYYTDSFALREHLKKSHFLCEMGHCSSGEIVSAFENYEEYSNHLLTDHGINAGPVSVNFRVRRSGETSHEYTGARSGPQEIQLHPNDFPSLSGGPRGNPLARGPYAAMSLSRQSAHRAEDFPSLAPSASPKPSQAGSSLEEQLSLVRRRRPLQATASREQQAKNTRSEEETRKLERNRKLAEAFGVAAPTTVNASKPLDPNDPLALFEANLKTPIYPEDLLRWAREKPRDVYSLERKIAGMLEDKRGTSVNLKPMPSNERRRVHMLATFYGLNSIAYDKEPRRYVSLIKQGDSSLPGLLLSQAARGVGQKRQNAVFDLKPSRNLKQECCIFLTITEAGYKPRDLQRFLNQYLPSAVVQSMIVWSTESLLVEFVDESIHSRVLASLRAQQETMPFQVLLYDEMTGGGIDTHVPGSNGDGPTVPANEPVEDDSGRWVHSVLKGKLSKPPPPPPSSSLLSSKKAVCKSLNGSGSAEGLGSVPPKPEAPRNIWEALSDSDEDEVKEIEFDGEHRSGEMPQLDKVGASGSEGPVDEAASAALRNLLNISGDDSGSSQLVLPGSEGANDHGSANEWSCTKCTFLNSMIQKFCEMCGEPNLYVADGWKEV